jgi:hypothetical protein
VAPSFAQKANVPIKQDVVALAQPRVIEGLLLMDTERNGKISEKDFMNLTEAVFDRLDKDKKEELDPGQFGNRSASEALPGDEEQLPRQNA